MNKRWYYPQLDSIRALSFIAIFLYHTAVPNQGSTEIGKFINYIYHHLHLGLDVFFILSAYLLTWLGLNERGIKQSFSFKNYFTRRVLRIWPLYYLIMLFSFILLPFISHWLSISISLPPPVWYLFFIANFYHVNHVFFLRALWTISVEEQFYLILGICLKFFSKYLFVLFVFFMGTSIVFSVSAIVFKFSFYANTLTYFFNFAAGAIAAITVHKNSRFLQFFSRLPKWGTLAFYCYLPIHFFIFYLIDSKNSLDKNVFWELACRYMFIIYITLLVIEQVINKNRTSFLEKNKFLVFTGKISFGLYCFHAITLTFIKALFPCPDCTSFWLRIVGIFVINYGIAVISYYYFESRFLRLKEKYRKS